MTFEKTNLSGDEEIVRIFARHPNSSKKIRVRPSDFERPMERMSGISMFRASAKEHARSRWQTSWPKGILIAKAAPLIALGLEFYHTGNDHFSVRCLGCNLSQNQLNQGPLCIKTRDGDCDFAPPHEGLEPNNIIPLGICDQLSQIFQIDTLPYI